MLLRACTVYDTSRGHHGLDSTSTVDITMYANMQRLYNAIVSKIDFELSFDHIYLHRS
jgi:hypothetical protein